MDYTIDPHKITDFKRNKVQLQTFMLFSILAAGKNSKIQSEKLERFLYPAKVAGITPFDLIKILIDHDLLRHSMEFNKLGQYTRIEKAFAQSIDHNMFHVTLEELEGISGVGPKTARFFLMHSRPNQRVAALDTHILRYIREELGVDTPKSTPSGKRYNMLERVFLSNAKELGKTPADLDLEVWSRYNKGQI